jgi:hypothetical protein
MFTARIPPRTLWYCRRNVGIKMRFMAKKTEMSDSSLWIIAIVLFVLTAWMYFKR